METFSKAEEVIRQEWHDAQGEYLAEMRRVLQKNDISPIIYLANSAAGVCGVDYEDFTGKKSGKGSVRQSRWLFWYAYRMMTNETYIKIAEVSRQVGIEFSLDGIRKAVEQMRRLIETESVWKRRWHEMSKVIKILTEE